MWQILFLRTITRISENFVFLFSACPGRKNLNWLPIFPDTSPNATDL